MLSSIEETSVVYSTFSVIFSTHTHSAHHNNEALLFSYIRQGTVKESENSLLYRKSMFSYVLRQKIGFRM